MALGEGELIVVRNPGSKQPFGNASLFLLCPDYPGYFKRDELWRHNKCCEHKTKPKKWKKLQLEARPLLPTASTSTAEVDKELFSHVLAVIKDDSISSLARHDEIILKFGAGHERRNPTKCRKGCATLLGCSQYCVQEVRRRRRN